MSISFNQVPIDIRVPGQYIEIDNSQAFRGLSGMPTKVLVIGQMLAAGTADALEPYLITSVDQGKELFGIGSQLAHMLEKFKGANSYIEVHAIAQEDDGGGNAATGKITIGGAPTAAGTLNIYIGGRRVRAKVANDDDASDIAATIIAAIQADADLPVSAAVDGVDDKIVNLTAKHKGECANSIDLRINYYADEKTPAGVTVTFTAMSGGTANPDVEDVLTAIGDEWYTDFVMAYADSANIVAMEEELADRFGPLKMKDGHLYYGLSDTHGNLITAGDARNSPHVTIGGLTKCPNPPYELAAAMAAVCSYFLKIDPARPVQTLPLPGILPPAIKDRYTLEERNLLLFHGISTFMIDAGDVVRLERVITTYKENPFGAADPSYLDIETMKTLAYLRYDTRTFIALRYPRYKLADDGTNFARGQAVVTPSVIRASLIGRFRQWEENGLVENIEQFKEDLIVERDSNDPNRVNALIPPDIINQLRVFAGLVQFKL